ncbi:FAD-dependent oxidoreductase [Halanaeroarchaeum sp. HSR-CO]|uniref:FAD-dependent oxidoreductase n=1 Tax=Halanaeroarchaeum sp. HSR-CO TaxID=2866382 RepID=UPI00217D5813|nr:FAD-binding oxidoreductase [Halanaeroarchaeum sp. HSR-CO]
MEDVAVPVRSVESAGADAVAITFETPAQFDGAPGQFVRLSATIDDEVVQRFYTLSSPDVEETFEVTVSVDPAGSLAPWLADREPGDTVTVSGPYGDHYYEGEDAVVVIAAGPGIGPAVGIGERALREGTGVAIVYPEGHPIHRDRMAALTDGGATIVTFEDDLEGAVEEAVTAVDGAPFVYGFEEFVSAVANALEAVGIDADEAKIESFGPGPER